MIFLLSVLTVQGSFTLTGISSSTYLDSEKSPLESLSNRKLDIPSSSSLLPKQPSQYTSSPPISKAEPEGLASES